MSSRMFLRLRHASPGAERMSLHGLESRPERRIYIKLSERADRDHGTGRLLLRSRLHIVRHPSTRHRPLRSGRMGIILFSIPFFFVLMGVELAYSAWSRRGFYRLNDSIADL